MERCSLDKVAPCGRILKDSNGVGSCIERRCNSNLLAIIVVKLEPSGIIFLLDVEGIFPSQLNKNVVFFSSASTSSMILPLSCCVLAMKAAFFGVITNFLVFVGIPSSCKGGIQRFL